MYTSVRGAAILFLLCSTMSDYLFSSNTCWKVQNLSLSLLAECPSIVKMDAKKVEKGCEDISKHCEGQSKESTATLPFMKEQRREEVAPMVLCVRCIDERLRHFVSTLVYLLWTAESHQSRTSCVLCMRTWHVY